MDKAMLPRKQEAHGRIGEAAVAAKCWMHGVRAYNTNGLRANFAGSDLIIDTADPRRKLLIQVKTGYPLSPGKVYLTQATGDADLLVDKFRADFVVFVNIDKKVGESHRYEGLLGFEHLHFYVVPAEDANRLFRAQVRDDYEKPKRDGSRRSLTNMAVQVDVEKFQVFRDAWHRLRNAVDLGRGAISDDVAEFPQGQS